MMIKLVMFLILFLFGFSLLFFKFKKALTPISIIYSIWCFVILATISEVTLLPSPSYFAFFSLFLAVISFLLGVLTPSLNNKTLRSVYYRELDKNIPFKKIYISLAFISPLVIYAAYFMISKILTVGLDGYLMDTRWVGEKFVIFSGPLGYSIATTFVKGFLYGTFFYAVSLFYVDNDKKIFIITSILLLTYSVVLFSRVEMLVFLFTLFIASVSAKNIDIRGALKIFTILFISIFLLMFFTFIRSGGEISVYEMLVSYFVEYHLYGVTIFCMVLDNKIDVVDNSYTFGLLTFPIISFFPEHLLSVLFNERLLSPATIARDELQDIISIPLSNGTFRDTNAFYTSLYLFYRDFGLIGLSILPFTYGYFFSKSYISWGLKKRSVDFAFVLFWSYTGYTALFFPPQIAEFYWFCFIILMLFKYRFSYKV